MGNVNSKNFGAVIGRLISKENLSRKECRMMFEELLNDTHTDMQQGAFLAALAAKGETIEEIAGVWEAVYQLDTVQVKPDTGSMPVVDNCGTGMDSFKTFNISTAASVIAAAAGSVLARHGARAITSTCGTVDMVEALGVDVECNPDKVVKSIEQAGVGIFNGMSPKIHPKALGRILSQISFGSVLNIAASLANPALPEYGVRGVCSKELFKQVPEIMREIGYRRALVVNGTVAGSVLSMDEASTIGETYVAELQENGLVRQYSFYPEEFGIKQGSPVNLQPSASLEDETRSMIALLAGHGCADRTAIASLNAGLILYISGIAFDIKEGYNLAKEVTASGRALEKLINWVSIQNEDPVSGVQKLINYLN